MVRSRSSHRVSAGRPNNIPADGELVRDRSALGVLWHRRWVVVATFVIFVVLAGVISKVLPKVYSATSSLVVVQKENAATFDAVQAAQVTARTYSDIVSAPVIASQVAHQLGMGLTTS